MKKEDGNHGRRLMEKMKSGKGKKGLLALAVVVVLGGTGLIYGLSVERYTGVVEATILSHVSEVSGKVLEMPVELGQQVAKGDVLAVIDSGDLEYGLEQLELTLEKKRLALSQEDGGTGSYTQGDTTYMVAQSNYQSAASAYQKAAQDYRNAQVLYEQGAISKDALDQAKVRNDGAAASLASAKALLDNAGSGDITSVALLDIQMLESQIEEKKEKLSKCRVCAQEDGVIITKSYMPGDVVSPGFNLVEIAALEGTYLVFYYPMEKIHDLEYEDVLLVKGEGQTLEAVVKYIDVESVYTPKDMQTLANKNKKSIQVKLLLPEGSGLKPGQEAWVVM